MLKIFSQNKNYEKILRIEAKPPFYIKIDEDNYILLFRTYKKIFGIKIPFFCKISSFEGFNFTSEENFHTLIKKVIKMLESPLVIKSQITTHPLVKIPKNSFFNSEYHTYILKLNQFNNIDEYMNFLNSKVRNVVRRSLKQNLVIKEVLNDEDMKKYVEFVNSNRVENGISKIDEEHFFSVWNSFKKDGLVKYFLVYKGNIPLASQGVNISLNGFTLVQTTTSKKAYEMKLNANDFLQYNMVKNALENGFDYVDWGGAQPYSDDLKMKAIDKFKAKWGGELISYPVYLKGY